MYKKIFSALLCVATGAVHAETDGEIALRTKNGHLTLGHISIDADARAPKIALRAANGSGFCRDAVFDISVDELSGAVIDFGKRKWIYRFEGLNDGYCRYEGRDGYSLEFSLVSESDMKEVDLAVTGIFDLSSAESVPLNTVVFDDAGVLDCIFADKKWKFLEIYNDFGKKLDENGGEMEQRMPSVVFHLVSNAAKCKEAYVVAFFPVKSNSKIFFVTSAAAIPL